MLTLNIQTNNMADVFTLHKRSEIMSRITSRNTSPELAVRKVLSSLKIRYRLHVKDLPGKPDMANKSRKFAIFANGCFWHQHEDCSRSTMPKTNRDYWIPKLKRNVERQKENINLLEKKGWLVVRVWECETKTKQDREKLVNRLEQKLI